MGRGMAAVAISGFDVMVEPWIPVVPLDGSAPRDVSIVDVLTRGRTYRRIVCETPTMTAALHRLLLAVIHRAYRGPEDLDAWSALWKAEPGLPAEPLMDYHQRFAGRFDLLDERRPFLQCPSLRGGERKSIATLVAFRSTGQHRTLFDHTRDSDSPRLGLAEAARWLVTIQLYDTGGMKADPRSGAPAAEKKSAVGKDSLAPHGNHFGCVLVEGANLHETLLLNTLRYDPEDGKPHTTTTPADRPVWEASEALGLGHVSREAFGWTDLLTWQGRRVLLFLDVAPEVVGALVAPGARLRPIDKSSAELKGHELLGIEHMAAFEAPGRSPRSRPRAIRLNELKGAWRHGRDLIFSDEPWWISSDWRANLHRPDSGSEVPMSAPARRRPRVLDLIATAAEDGLIPGDTVYTLRIFGQTLEASSTKIGTWLEESIPLPVSLLRLHDASLGNAIGRVLELAASLGEGLRAFERNYRKACQPARSPGSKSKDPADSASTWMELAYWPRIAAPFARLLHELGEHAAREDWQKCRTAIEAWGTEVVQLADRTAEAWISASIRRNRALDSVAKAANVYDQQKRDHARRLQIFRALLDTDIPLGTEGNGQDDQ